MKKYLVELRGDEKFVVESVSLANARAYSLLRFGRVRFSGIREASEEEVHQYLSAGGEILCLRRRREDEHTLSGDDSSQREASETEGASGEETASGASTASSPGRESEPVVEGRKVMRLPVGVSISGFGDDKRIVRLFFYEQHRLFLGEKILFSGLRDGKLVFRLGEGAKKVAKIRPYLNDKASYAEILCSENSIAPFRKKDSTAELHITQDEKTLFVEIPKDLDPGVFVKRRFLNRKEQDRRTDPVTRLRIAWQQMRLAAADLRSLGFEVEITAPKLSLEFDGEEK